MSDRDNETTNISLPNGRVLTLVERTRALHISDRDGVVELEIELHEAGPVVRVRASALHVEASGSLSVGCERFELRAREGIQLTSDRDLTASVAGDLDLRAGRHARWEGQSVRVRASRGEAQLEASDDVRIDGERILLNS
jgi:hypothetical protein